jgi:hypothetical protein
MTLDHCPRCLAHRHVAQPLQSIAHETFGFGLADDDVRAGESLAATVGETAAAGRDSSPS